jgi:hypothetical protein
MGKTQLSSRARRSSLIRWSADPAIALPLSLLAMTALSEVASRM